MIFIIFQLSSWKKSTILFAFFPFSAQIIISIRGCVACNDLWPWPIFSRSFGLDLENRVRYVVSTVLDGFFHIWYKWSLAWEGVSRVMTFDFDLYLAIPTFSGQQHTPIDFQTETPRGGGYPRRWHRLIYLVGSGNGLSPVWRRAITWTNALLLSIWP